MASIDDVLRSMDSFSRKLLSNAIHEYEKTGSKTSLQEITSILRNWTDDDPKILLPDFMKKLR